MCSLRRVLSSSYILSTLFSDFYTLCICKPHTIEHRTEQTTCSHMHNGWGRRSAHDRRFRLMPWQLAEHVQQRQAAASEPHSSFTVLHARGHSDAEPSAPATLHASPGSHARSSIARILRLTPEQLESVAAHRRRPSSSFWRSLDARSDEASSSSASSASSSAPRPAGPRRAGACPSSGALRGGAEGAVGRGGTLCMMRGRPYPTHTRARSAGCMRCTRPHPAHVRSCMARWKRSACPAPLDASSSSASSSSGRYSLVQLMIDAKQWLLFGAGTVRWSEPEAWIMSCPPRMGRQHSPTGTKTSLPTWACGAPARASSARPPP